MPREEGACSGRVKLKAWPERGLIAKVAGGSGGGSGGAKAAGLTAIRQMGGVARGEVRRAHLAFRVLFDWFYCCFACSVFAANSDKIKHKANEQGEPHSNTHTHRHMHTHTGTHTLSCKGVDFGLDPKRRCP